MQELLKSSAVGEAAPRMSVRISDVVELADVQYVEEHKKLGLPCCSRTMSSLRKSKKRRVPMSLVLAKKKFLMKVRLLAVPHLKLLLKKVLRSQVQEEVVVIAVMPQFSKVDININ